MKALVLCESLETDRTSSGICNAKIILALKMHFKEVKVIVNHDIDLIPVGICNDIEKIHTDYKESIIGKIPKLRGLPTYIYGVGLKQKDQISRWITKLNNTNLEEYDVIYSLGTGTEFLSAYAMSKISKSRYKTWVMNVHDPFPTSNYPEPYKKPSNYIDNKLSKLFSVALNKADYISFPSLRLSEWMSQFYPAIKNKSIIQHHIGLENEKMSFLKFDKIYNNFKKDKINIVHTGTLLGPRDPKYLFQAYLELQKENPEVSDKIVLHIIGKVAKEHKDINIYAKDNIIIDTFRYSYADSLEIQKRADVLLLLEADAKESPFMPGKLADYLVAKKPILALTPSASETSRLLGQNYGLNVRNGNVEQIKSALLKIYQNFKTNNQNNIIPSTSLLEEISTKKWNETLINVLTTN